jgi:uncharacterized protein YgbK (DUF1537 family)
VKLGVIGDDFTGSSDIALMLRDGGMRVVQYAGIPEQPARAGVEAGVVALKIRSVPAKEAVAQALAAYRWLKAQGCTQFYYKYCSTFDSTPEGNIGPVLDALIEQTGAAHGVIVCPAFPATGRTVYQGHLFVNDRLLSESGMENHPVTPMGDPDIRRWLAQQSRFPVGHLAYDAIGAGAVAQGLEAAFARGEKTVVCDALKDDDLLALGRAAREHVLLSGGSGLALGLAANHGCDAGDGTGWCGDAGPVIGLCGSCSATTLAQIGQHRDRGFACYRVDPGALADMAGAVEDMLERIERGGELPLVYSSATPDRIARNKAEFGAGESAAMFEAFFAALARGAVARGYTRLVVAGGETSGAVVEALEIGALEIGPMIDPGVPAVRASGQDICMALKSGNFGAVDFFEKAARRLEGA